MKIRAVRAELFNADRRDFFFFNNFCAHALEAYKGRGGVAALIVNLRITLTGQPYPRRRSPPVPIEQHKAEWPQSRSGRFSEIPLFGGHSNSGPSSR
jgi:hypothetical protein